MSNEPLLSVCIPTYNRPVELKQTLSILVKQHEELPAMLQDKVQYIVSDNHSNYDASAVISEFTERLAIQSIVHSRNIGPTLNFEYCFHQAKGRYVLILSDDDHLVDGALAEILTCLIHCEPDIVFLPFSPQPKPERGTVSTRSMERNPFLEHVGFLPTLISACIFKRQLISGVLGRYLDTNLHHYYYFLCALEDGERFEVFVQQILECPYENNSGGYDWFSVFGEQFFRIVDEFEAFRIERRILTAIQRKMLIERIIPTFVNRRIHGHTISQNFNDESLGKIFLTVSRRCRRFTAFWLMFFPIYVVPAGALSMIKRLYLQRKKNVFFQSE